MKTTTKMGIAAIVAASALTLTGCSFGPTPLQQVFEACSLGEGADLADGGKTLTIDMIGEEDYSGVPLDKVMCVIEDEKLAMPSYIQESITSTRALDGKQSDEFNGISVSWSYHPDSGLNLILHQK